MYTDDVIRRVRDSVDIQELISGYVTLKRAGKNWQGLCPFHNEKTPSFSVNPDKQIFHCFGCGVGGDVFKFLELQKGLNFPEAVRELAERAGIALPESRPGRDHKKEQDERKALLAVTADAASYFQKELEGAAGSAARAYLAKRGLTQAVIDELGLGYSRPEWDGLLRHLRQKGHTPALLEKAGLIVKRSEGEGHYDRFRGRIIFPIRDIDGKTIAFGGRVMDDSLPKYLNSPETPLYSKSNVLFCMDKAKDAARKNDHFIIVEGYLDAIACHQFGVRNAVATLGTALTDGHLRMMRRFTKNLKLIFDPDPAGVKAALRSFDLLAGSGMSVKVVLLPGGDDPDTFLQKKGFDAFVASLKASAPLMDFILDQVVKDGAKAEIDEKDRLAAEMLGYLGRLPSEIERSHYLKKTAEALEINETDLRRELAKRGGGVHRPGEQAQPAGAAPRTGRRPRAEETLIHLMLRDEGLARRIAGEIAPEDFTDPLLQRAFKKITDALARGAMPDVRTLSEDSDSDLSRLFSYYAVLELDCEKQEGPERILADKEKTCDDCLSAVKQADPEQKIRQIVKLIREAEAKGDETERCRLQALQMELSRRPGRRIPGLK